MEADGRNIPAGAPTSQVKGGGLDQAGHPEEVRAGPSGDPLLEVDAAEHAHVEQPVGKPVPGQGVQVLDAASRGASRGEVPGAVIAAALRPQAALNLATEVTCLPASPTIERLPLYTNVQVRSLSNLRYNSYDVLDRALLSPTCALIDLTQVAHCRQIPGNAIEIALLVALCGPMSAVNGSLLGSRRGASAAEPVSRSSGKAKLL
jgi:hypothetical protein